MSNRNRIWCTTAARAVVRELAAEVSSIAALVDLCDPVASAIALGAVAEKLSKLAGPERKPAADAEGAA